MLWDPWEKDFFSPHVDHRDYNSAFGEILFVQPRKK